MIYTFDDYKLVGNNCPYFTGIKKHGPKLELLLDYNTRDLFNVYGENVLLHIHQDETIYITTSHYNWNTEEWEEKIVKRLTDNSEVKKNLDETFGDIPLYRSSSFPYNIKTTRDWSDSLMICDSYDSLICFLKNY